MLARTVNNDLLAKLSHRVLGFDARERFVPSQKLYGEQRRRRQLLREDVEKPLSADVLVWPTVFQNEGLESLELFDLSLGLMGMPRPVWTGPFQDLWVSLAELDLQLATVRKDLRGDVSVVALSVEHTWRYPLWNRPIFDDDAADPDKLDERWHLLGFDVGDGFLRSALMNGAFSKADLDSLRAMFADELNELHLFDDLEVAKLCALHAHERAPARATYFSYGLWQRNEPSLPSRSET